MSKKIKNIKKYEKKKVRIDPLYQSLWFSKLLNKFMLNGKKHVMEKIFYSSFFEMKKKLHREPLKILFLMLIKIKPLLGFIPKRLGKIWKKIPVPLEPRRQYIMALKWFVWHTKTQPDRTLQARLIRVLSDHFHQKKTALTKFRHQYHVDLVQARVNTRFRWK